jgi:hypothetical protein
VKTVALIDPQRGGHHFAFICLFAKYFLKLGHRVYIIYPERGIEIKDYLIVEGFNDREFSIEICELKKNNPSFNSIWSLPLATLRLWRQTSGLLSKIEDSHKVKFDLVFFAWLDDHICNYLPHQLVDFFFHYKWSGLYFHPWYLNSVSVSERVSISSVDNVLLSRNCVSVAIHDEFNVEMLKGRLNKKVVLFPEIADSTSPLVDYPLAVEIKNKANGRLVVGLIGLSNRKGFLTFLRTIRKLSSDRFYFFFSGSFEDSDFNEEEKQEIVEYLQKLPSNAFYHPKYLQEGGQLNAVINAFDVLFLVYNNFQSSSNFITKAAIFKKLVLSTERFWMGRVTSKYRLGLTTKEGDADMAARNLLELEENKFRLREEMDCNGYLLVHDERNLEHSIRDIF